LTLAMIRVREQHRENGADRTPFVAALREGFAVVFGSAVLLRIMAATALSNLGSSMIVAVYLIYAYRILHLSPAVVGLLFAVANAGFAGAFFAPRIARRFGVGPTLVVTLAVPVLAQFALPLALVVAQPLAVLFAVELVITLFVPIYNITQISLRHRLVPPEQHGRMNATLRTVVWGTLPIGTLAGGALGSTIGIVPTLVAGAVVSALAVLPLLTRPIRELRHSPVRSSTEDDL
jgi:predicted MFS family arabinose efflux permease